VKDKADVVYGSRFSSGAPHRVLYFWHSFGNKVLTFLSKMLTDLNLADMETCYKAFRANIVREFESKKTAFGSSRKLPPK